MRMAHAVLPRYGRAATVSHSSVYMIRWLWIHWHSVSHDGHSVVLWISIRINFLDTSWISYKLHKGQYIILHCFVGFPRLSLIQHARYLTQNSVTSCLPFLIIPLSYRMWHCYVITGIQPNRTCAIICSVCATAYWNHVTVNPLETVTSLEYMQPQTLLSLLHNFPIGMHVK